MKLLVEILWKKMKIGGIKITAERVARQNTLLSELEVDKRFDFSSVNNVLISLELTPTEDGRGTTILYRDYGRGLYSFDRYSERPRELICRKIVRD